MLPELLQTTNLFYLLHSIDVDLANKQKSAGCPYCGGPLHHSNYLRKPRGGPDNLPDEICVRFSFCCGHEDCRRRTLPSSTLYMDRRVYFRGAIMILMTLRQNSPQEYSKAKLKRLFDVSVKTINRWRQFYLDIFPDSPQWQRVRGLLSSTITNSKLPGELVAYFLQHTKSEQEALVKCLRLIATG